MQDEVGWLLLLTVHKEGSSPWESPEEFGAAAACVAAVVKACAGQN